MNYFSLPFPLPLFSHTHKSPTLIRFHPHTCTTHPHHQALSFPSLSSSLQSSSLACHSSSSYSSLGSSVPSSECGIPLINLQEEYAEKDWSFLELGGGDSDDTKMDRIICAGEIGEGCRVLVSSCSDGFVDRVVDSSPPCELVVVVHDSLLVLAAIKERYDDVKCWQGELIYVPHNWAPFDVVFLYFLPALPFGLPQLFQSLAKCCSPGARIVISHHQGRQVLEQQRQRYPNVIVSDLPEKYTLQSVAADHSFEITEFVDEPDFYLAVLKYPKAKDDNLS